MKKERTGACRQRQLCLEQNSCLRGNTGRQRSARTEVDRTGGGLRAEHGFSLSIAASLDDDPKTGWAVDPQFGKSHWATFAVDDGDRRQTLDGRDGWLSNSTSNVNTKHAIGRPRLSYCRQTGSTGVPTARWPTCRSCERSASWPRRGTSAKLNAEDANRIARSLSSPGLRSGSSLNDSSPEELWRPSRSRTSRK